MSNERLCYALRNQITPTVYLSYVQASWALYIVYLCFFCSPLNVLLMSRKLPSEASIRTHTRSKIFRLVHMFRFRVWLFSTQYVFRFINGSFFDRRQYIINPCYPKQSSFVTNNFEPQLLSYSSTILRPSLNKASGYKRTHLRQYV